MKRIVILCDGTWNHPDETTEENPVPGEHPKRIPVPTNVVKLAAAITPIGNGVSQQVYYDAGIGSSGSMIQRVYDGATGSGISAKIKQAYRFLVQQFEIGDELFLFGFSRGAFTVRSLAGLIRNCGILRRDAVYILPVAFALYRSRRPSSHPKKREATLFRRTNAVEDITPIAFISVWDTVGSFGNPLYLGRLSPSNRFHDTDLSTHVKAAYQALAVDETRRNFRPILWHQRTGASGQIMEQRWFAGSHSDIGGGYTYTSLSDLALLWLATKAKEAGLGIGNLLLAPCYRGTIVNSRKAFYRLVRKWHRPIGVPPRGGPTREAVGQSVITCCREDQSYRPPKLFDSFHHPMLLK